LDAYALVQQFVMRAHCGGRRHVAIITGKGRTGEAGVLRSNLPHWLNELALRPLISAFATARAEKGGEGVMHVLLKRG
jgi:DNA-nicking Smr family endonuclease